MTDTNGTGEIVFQKNYTRDTALFLQEIWAKDQSVYLPQLLGKVNPHLPGIVHYVRNGSVEIWEHMAATEWLLDTILEKNLSDKSFLDSQIKIHQGVLEDIRPYWEKKVLMEKRELVELAKLFEKGITSLMYIFRTAQNDKTPTHLREKALAVRERDVFFSHNDLLLSASLTAMFPEIKGYENYIFAHEVDKLPSIEILKERKEHFVLMDGSETFLGSLDEFKAKNPSYHFEQEEVGDVKELKGSIAYKGKATGVVRIISRREQNSEVQEGDILVSSMTTPDFLPAMQKALAFITDEGGITCHAAIVAREMKKPCIIGTKFATSVLKDGDMVEVDAEQGIVRIL